MFCSSSLVDWSSSLVVSSSSPDQIGDQLHGAVGLARLLQVPAGGQLVAPGQAGLGHPARERALVLQAALGHPQRPLECAVLLVQQGVGRPDVADPAPVPDAAAVVDLVQRPVARRAAEHRRRLGRVGLAHQHHLGEVRVARRRRVGGRPDVDRLPDQRAELARGGPYRRRYQCEPVSRHVRVCGVRRILYQREPPTVRDRGQAGRAVVAGTGKDDADDAGPVGPRRGPEERINRRP
jgi:hypothetical protein